MSLIALTTDPDPTVGSPSVLTSSAGFDPDGAAIRIQNADGEQLKSGSQHCNAGYDLRVGPLFRDHRNPRWQTLGSNDKIYMLPGTAVIIQTEELVEFPKKCFGEIFPKVTLLDNGIANITSKVDPGFHGHLRITVFNHGKQTVPLSRGDQFCSLNVFDVRGLVRPYNNRKEDFGTGRSDHLGRTVRD